jgi:zinc protease
VHTTPERYNDVLKRLGADGNAFTTDDWTCYHVVVAASGLPTVMELEADRFMNLSYGLEAFQKEAAAVLGEYNKNASIPFNALFERLHDTAYTTHTYKHTTMGFLKDIEDMPNQYEHSLSFFERWYRADNAVLVVAGDIDPEQVFGLARRNYGAWRPGIAPLATPVEPDQTNERGAHIPWAAPTLPILAMAFHAPAFDPEDREERALDVLAQAYFAPTSALHKELVLDRQWVDWLGRRRRPSRSGSLRRACPGQGLRSSRRRSRRDRAHSGACRVDDAHAGQAPERDLAPSVRVPVGPGDTRSGRRHGVSFRAAHRGDVDDRPVVRHASRRHGGGRRPAAARTFRPANRTVVTLAQNGAKASA